MSDQSCTKSASGKHEWQDTGFANLDDCAICGATRTHPAGEQHDEH